MQKILKMTDISIVEAKRLLSFVRYASMLNPQFDETDQGLVLTCDVDEQNRRVYAEVLASLQQFVYTDTNQNPYERVCDLLEVRNQKVVLVEQGTRSQVAAQLLATSEMVDDNIAGVAAFVSKQFAMQSFFAADNESFANAALSKFDADIVLATFAEFEKDPCVPSICEVVVGLSSGQTFAQKYQILGTKRQIADRLAFLATCFLAKKIF